MGSVSTQKVILASNLPSYLRAGQATDVCVNPHIDPWGGGGRNVLHQPGEVFLSVVQQGLILRCSNFPAKFSITPKALRQLIIIDGKHLDQCSNNGIKLFQFLE